MDYTDDLLKRLDELERKLEQMAVLLQKAAAAALGEEQAVKVPAGRSRIERDW